VLAAVLAVVVLAAPILPGVYRGRVTDDPNSDYLEPRFCSQCAALLRRQFAHGKVHWDCPGCGHRHVRRPTVGVAVAVVEHAEVLLVERRYGARAGAWCIPCGHVEWDEDVRAAAKREVKEEAGLVVELDGLLDTHTNRWRPARQTVGIWFRGHRVGGTLQAGDDAVAARFFGLDTLPSPLAFPTDILVLDLLRRRHLGPETGC
jgi:ADP-ribose pyrophosphatase YjhB (NUDIX family)